MTGSLNDWLLILSHPHGDEQQLVLESASKVTNVRDATDADIAKFGGNASTSEIIDSLKSESDESRFNTSSFKKHGE